jgi:hypothetical protein
MPEPQRGPATLGDATTETSALVTNNDQVRSLAREHLGETPSRAT